MYEQCPRYPNYRLYNSLTGQRLPYCCNCYACPVCGRRKKQRLYKALQSWLKPFPYLRMWTFTFSSTCCSNPYTHYRILSDAWRRFVNNIRRCKGLSESHRNFNYLKVSELHKSGFVHYHVMIDKYLPFNVVLNCWKSALSRSIEHNELKHYNSNITIKSNYKDLNGYCFVKGRLNKDSAASYVTKYITKNIELESEYQIRHYSKSSKVSLFKKYPKQDGWTLETCFIEEGSSLLLTQNRITSPDLFCLGDLEILMAANLKWEQIMKTWNAKYPDSLKEYLSRMESG